jgi:hypothetical protein
MAMANTDVPSGSTGSDSGTANPVSVSSDALAWAENAVVCGLGG